MFRKIISFFLIYTIFCHSLFAQATGDQKLVNALHGLSFLAHSKKVSESEISKFIESNKAELDKHNLTDKFKKLQDLMSKMKNCGNTQMSFDFVNPLLQGVEPCKSGGSLNIAGLDQLFSTLDKIQSEMNGDKNSIDQEKFKKLADKVYQEQRRMYMGAAYLAYSKYRAPRFISFEDFLNTWEVKNQKPDITQINSLGINSKGMSSANQNLSSSPHVALNQLMKVTPLDSDWSAKLEEITHEDKENFPDAQKNIKELSDKSSKNLREIYKDYQELEEVSRTQKQFEMAVKQVERVVRSKDNQSDWTHTQTRGLEDPFVQGFDFLKSNHSQAGSSDSFLRLNKQIEKERKFKDGVSFDVATSPLLAHYVAEIKKTNPDVVILDDTLDKNGKPLNYKNVESRSPVDFLNKYGLSKDANERLKNSSGEYITNNFKGKKVINVTEIMAMHRQLMNPKELFGEELTKARANMANNWRSSYENLQVSRNAFNQTDGRLLRIAANAGENKGGLTVFNVHKKRESIAENEKYNLGEEEVKKVDAFYGLDPNKTDLQVNTTNTLIEVFLDQSKQLMRKVSENYLSQPPSNFLQDAIAYHPALVNKIIAEDPSLAGIVCALPVMKMNDEARTKRNKEIYDSAKFCIGMASLIITAGVSAPIVLGLSTGLIVYNTALGLESFEHYDYANKVYNTTGQLRGKEANEAEALINEYYKESMGYFQNAVIDGAFTPLQIYEFVKILPKIKGNIQLWKKLSSNPKAVIDFLQLTSKEDILEIEIRSSLKDSAKEE